jgi:hypothetical protein
MEYDVKMGSDAMIYMPRLIKTDSGIQQFWGWGDTQTAGSSHKPISVFYR